MLNHDQLEVGIKKWCHSQLGASLLVKGHNEPTHQLVVLFIDWMVWDFSSRSWTLVNHRGFIVNPFCAHLLFSFFLPTLTSTTYYPPCGLTYQLATNPPYLVTYSLYILIYSPILPTYLPIYPPHLFIYLPIHLIYRFTY